MSDTSDIDKIPLKEWNSGVFSSALRGAGIVPKARPGGIHTPGPPKSGPTTKFNSINARAALTEVYSRSLQRFGSYFDIANFEPSLPQGQDQDTSEEEREKLFSFSQCDDNYPPHLNHVPDSEYASLTQIFDTMRLADTGTVLENVGGSWVEDYAHGEPDDGYTMASLEANNTSLRQKDSGLFSLENIGDRPDWYSDAVFAQQQFTGTNPVTIRLASADWVSQFKQAAADLGNTAALEHLNAAPAGSLYIQDCSYFRSAVGLEADKPFISDHKLFDDRRYGCAAVSLFQLLGDGELHYDEKHPDVGKLHPLAIVIDYKGSMQNSVKIFNKRLRPSDPTDSEPDDWPWRYAKTAAQVSDWTHHELTTHLVNTHLVEEAVCVAAHIAFDPTHFIYRLLEPHWFRTLSLNAAARYTLVPSVIIPLSGMGTAQVYNFIQSAYKDFNWVENYVPNDLTRRGFPPDKLKEFKFHNYAYAKNIYAMWKVLREFVNVAIRGNYDSDEDVIKDHSIQRWSHHMRDDKGGRMKSFPEIKTIETLVEVVTMCIHIASPQHTAVNYLQMYYQAFVPAKPPSLFEPIPTTQKELYAMTDQKLTKSLPSYRPYYWLLASHLPYLLSYQVAEEQNLPNYALSLVHAASASGEPRLHDAAAFLYSALRMLQVQFIQFSAEMDKDAVPYKVLDPQHTATSILI